jgi:hypothetical protein
MGHSSICKDPRFDSECGHSFCQFHRYLIDISSISTRISIFFASDFHDFMYNTHTTHIYMQMPRNAIKDGRCKGSVVESQESN